MAENEIAEEIEKLRSPEGFLYAGLPKFRALFGRDSIISSMELMSHDRSIPLSTLEVLSKHQGKLKVGSTSEEPGKILHELQTDKKLIEARSRELPWLSIGKNYFSVDSTPLYIMLVADFLDNYGTPESFPQILDSTIKGLKWMLEFGIKDRFLAYIKAVKGSGLQSQSWRDGIGYVLDILKDPVSVVGVQGYAYLALQKGKQLIEKYSNGGKFPDLIERIDSSSATIRDQLDSYFFIEDDGYYALAVDGDGVAERSVTSDPGHLLVSGILSRKMERLVVDRIFEPDMLTDYGIRSMSSKSAYFDEKAYQRGAVWPQDNFIIWHGLEKRGYHKESEEIRERIALAMEEMRGFPEYFGVKRSGELIQNQSMRIIPCDPQAWSVGAYYDATKDSR
ncbi:MAG: amylo-alpha-1,6-glucosidase [Thermoplasmata archaeon]